MEVLHAKKIKKLPPEAMSLRATYTPSAATPSRKLYQVRITVGYLKSNYYLGEHPYEVGAILSCQVHVDRLDEPYSIELKLGNIDRMSAETMRWRQRLLARLEKNVSRCYNVSRAVLLTALAPRSTSVARPVVNFGDSSTLRLVDEQSWWTDALEAATPLV